jgi:hypothetical protein
METNRGLYAALLGSGLSRSAGVPTGWDIVLDLISKLACVQGADAGSDPARWYTETFGHEPSYSDLIGQLELSATARTQLLREYFEATEAEREEGKKVPTPAHKAIARLVAEGYIRVILTTNFDRLMEQALAETGIHPVVIATPDAAAGMAPLAHTRAIVIKLNGDYLDPRFRNTEGELADYEEPVRTLLGQVFDEYGLIVCGWSADWDTGLRAAIERCETRRFTTYWAHRGALGERAHSLVQLRRAIPLAISDADSLFNRLLEKVLALRELRTVEALSPAVALASLKRYLPEERHRIRLHDLVETETDRGFNIVFDRPRLNQITGTDVEQLRGRVHYYEVATATLRRLIAAGCFFGEPHQQPLWTRVLGRIATPPSITSGGVRFSDLELYPGLLLLYAAGIAAVAAEKYETLTSLLQARLRTYRGDLITAQEQLYSHNVIQKEAAQSLEGMERRYTPVSDHLVEVLREELRPYVPGGWTFENTFEWFEYLRALVYRDSSRAEWVPVGRFGWSLWRSEVLRTVSNPDEVGSLVPGLLSAGMFGGELERYRAAKRAVDEWIPKLGFH